MWLSATSSSTFGRICIFGLLTPAPLACRLRLTSTRVTRSRQAVEAISWPAMAFRDFEYERDYGLVPDLVKQFVVYLYRHIRWAAAPGWGLEQAIRAARGCRWFLGVYMLNLHKAAAALGRALCIDWVLPASVIRPACC